MIDAPNINPLVPHQIGTTDERYPAEGERDGKQRKEPKHKQNADGVARRAPWD